LAYKFEPGSTFKVVTAAAAFEDGGVGIDTPVECPGVATIGTPHHPQRGQVRVGHGAAASRVRPVLQHDVRAVGRRPAPSALPGAAKQFGIGVDFTVAGITTNAGSVPTPTSVAERVEAGIGQGKVQTTPFGMAVAAATVATGRMPLPQLIREIPTTTDGTESVLPSGVAQKSRPMMREVVTGGTAQELNRFGGLREDRDRRVRRRFVRARLVHGLPRQPRVRRAGRGRRLVEGRRRRRR
jgi:cell division protein FtsI/penicillin-binding protein 2